MLAENSSLVELNLKLNYLSDKAGQKFFGDIMSNEGLQVLDLSANLMTDDVKKKQELHLIRLDCAKSHSMHQREYQSFERNISLVY